MTAPRLSRGSRTRFFGYVAGLLCFFGLMILYHNSLTQLDAVKKTNELCQQQQESLTTQLQVIFDYKTRLEKSLQIEKAEHKQTRTEFQKKAENEKTNCDKNTQEANLRFASLQQQFSILESNNKDLQQDLSKVQKEKDGLETKLLEKETLMESLKSKYMDVLNAKTTLEETLRKIEGTQQNNQSEMTKILRENGLLKEEVRALKLNCKKEEFQYSQVSSRIKSTKPTISFSNQVKINQDLYQIPSQVQAQSETNVAEHPSAADNPQQPVPHPIDETLNVLPQPNTNQKSSTPKTSTTLKTLSVDENKKIPAGVVLPNRNLEDQQKPLRKPNVDENAINNGAMEVLDNPKPAKLRGAAYDYDEKGGDLQLENADDPEGEDDADDEYNGRVVDARQKDLAVRN